MGMKMRMIKPKSESRRTVHEIRDASVALAIHAVDGELGRNVGDPVHDEVTQNRTKNNEARRRAGSKEVPYSSCGDLVHWVLWKLGCRDPKLVNRNEPEDGLTWTIGSNLSRIRYSPHFRVWSPGGAMPEPGDAIYVANTDHVSIIVMEITGGWMTADYGQPYGRMRRCMVEERQGALWVAPTDRAKGGRRLVGWLDLDLVFGR
jgi:hypothetical protein